MFTTRDYHILVKRWRESLKTQRDDDEYEQVIALWAYQDLDVRFSGKTGIFFSLGVALYNALRCKTERTQLKGNCFLLEFQPASIITFLDDVQGTTLGEPCLTRDLSVEFVVPFRELKKVTFSFQTSANIEVIDDKKNIITNGTFCDENNKVVVKTLAHFSQNPRIVGKFFESESARSENWKNLEFLRICGENPDDSEMSFFFRVPFSNMMKIDSRPSWWKPSSLTTNSRPKTHYAFEGKFVIDGISFGQDYCHGLVQPLKTAEGPYSLLHGGAAASAWLEVLSNVEDIFLLRLFKLWYKRPIPLSSVAVVEWTKRGPAEWNATVYNLEHMVLQEVSALFFNENQSNL